MLKIDFYIEKKKQVVYDLLKRTGYLTDNITDYLKERKK